MIKQICENNDDIVGKMDRAAFAAIIVYRVLFIMKIFSWTTLGVAGCRSLERRPSYLLNGQVTFLKLPTDKVSTFKK